MKTASFILTSFLFIALVTGKASAQTVYITESGKKYHAKNCSVAKTGKKGIALADAKKQGYEACKVCKPEALTAAEEKKKVKK